MHKNKLIRLANFFIFNACFFFLLQACRGQNLDRGISLNVTEADSGNGSLKIPTHADFLIAHSTVEGKENYFKTAALIFILYGINNFFICISTGFYSWRNPAEGTWYIQCLCSVIDQYASSCDLSKMMTITARKVATEYASFHVDPSHHNQKQVPSTTSMLTREIYFFDDKN